MVRELVVGRSLQEVLDGEGTIEQALSALARSAEQVTLLHRAGMLHGDIKPANVIVTPSGEATLVDLGLAAPWQERGARAEGLTPKYAAPEVLSGRPVTVRAEVYALGVTLRDVLKMDTSALSDTVIDELRKVADRAVIDAPTDRYPSADEFASALRRAANLSPHLEAARSVALWPIVGTDDTHAQLLERVVDLAPSSVLRLVGPPGSGRSALLRRLAWSLGVEGRPLAWIDAAIVHDSDAVVGELGDLQPQDAFILIDDAERLGHEPARRIGELIAGGARLVLVGDAALSLTAEAFSVPRLERAAAADLVRRAVPSLTEHLVEHVVNVADARPGKLRRVVRLLASEAVTSEEDIDAVLRGEGVHQGSLAPADPLARAVHFLDRGRFKDAERLLDELDELEGIGVTVARARLHLGLGEAPRALELLRAIEGQANSGGDSVAQRAWSLYCARALLGTGEYGSAVEMLERVSGASAQELAQAPTAAGSSPDDAIAVEAMAYQGLALSYLGKHDDAQTTLGFAAHAAGCSPIRGSKASHKRVLAWCFSVRTVLRRRGPRTKRRLWQGSRRAMPACWGLRSSISPAYSR